MSKINIDKFICDLIEHSVVDGLFLDLNDALEFQGLTYRNGEIVEIDQPPLTEEQKAYIEEGLKNGSMIRWKDLAYAEPIFKADDWLVNKKLVSEPFCITQVNEPHYYLTNQDSFIKFGEEDKYRPWNIKDAKPGDVLMYEGYYNSIVLFHGIGLNGEGHINYYCKCDLANYDVSTQGDVAYMGDVEHSAKYYHPATKEQRDLLFQKMEEAGYKWNQEELKLEKIDKPQTIRFNKPEEIDSVWPKEIVDELLEETRKNTPKVKEELKKYFSNVFPTIYDIDIDKMVEEYKERILISQSLKYDDLLVRAIAYKQGLKDMLKQIKEYEK